MITINFECISSRVSGGWGPMLWPHNNTQNVHDAALIFHSRRKKRKEKQGEKEGKTAREERRVERGVIKGLKLQICQRWRKWSRGRAKVSFNIPPSGCIHIINKERTKEALRWLPHIVLALLAHVEEVSVADTNYSGVRWDFSLQMFLLQALK